MRDLKSTLGRSLQLFDDLRRCANSQLDASALVARPKLALALQMIKEELSDADWGDFGGKRISKRKPDSEDLLEIPIERRAEKRKKSHAVL